jgi:hypothetical protein
MVPLWFNEKAMVTLTLNNSHLALRAALAGRLSDAARLAGYSNCIGRSSRPLLTRATHARAIACARYSPRRSRPTNLDLFAPKARS